MKNSLTAALRYTHRQAEKTYDRKTANENKQMPVALARDYAEGHNDPEKSDESEEVPAAAGSDAFKAGDFVALVEPDSTSTSPRILLGQILSFEGTTEALLLWYEQVKHNLYKLTLNGEQWKEPGLSRSSKSQVSQTTCRMLQPTRLASLHSQAGHAVLGEFFFF